MRVWRRRWEWGDSLWVDRPAQAGKRVILEQLLEQGAGALGGGTGAGPVPGAAAWRPLPWVFVFIQRKRRPEGAVLGWQ